MVPGQVINLEKLQESHFLVISIFRTQKLSLLLQLFGLEYYEELVRMFYANIHSSEDSGDLEALVLGNHIIVNEYLFKDVFRSEYSCDIPFINGVWPVEFVVSLEASKSAVAKPNADLSDFSPLSMCFRNHIIATTLASQKGSLSCISNRDVFVLSYLLKKYRINWVVWIYEYVLESGEDPNPTASLPYNLLISGIIVDFLVDLSKYRSVEVDATYDSRNFASMGYTLVDNKWHKKESLKARIDTPNATRFS